MILAAAVSNAFTARRPVRTTLRLLAALLLCVGGAFVAAAPIVTNVRASQSPLTRSVDIRYDLQDSDSSALRVSLLVSEDGGSTWNVPAQSLSGFGFGVGVKPGSDRYILWDAPTDWPGRTSNKVIFRVVANDDPISTGMVLIPAGTFMMGNSTNAADGDARELPAHTLYVGAFIMDRFEVTKSLWDDVRAWGLTHGYADLPLGSGKAANHPVQTVSWYAAAKWCNARSQKDGLTPAYFTDNGHSTLYRSGNVDLVNAYVDWNASGYRLPTEAEWEKAARGGASGGRFPWSHAQTIDHTQANYYCVVVNGTHLYSYDVSANVGYHPAYAVNGTPYTSPVGSFAPNDFGIYDLSGNVWEWCWDWYSIGWYSQSGATISDSKGPPATGQRVLRGGSWGDWAINCRTAIRAENNGPSASNESFGFRCVRK